MLLLIRLCRAQINAMSEVQLLSSDNETVAVDRNLLKNCKTIDNLLKGRALTDATQI